MCFTWLLQRQAIAVLLWLLPQEGLAFLVIVEKVLNAHGLIGPRSLANIFKQQSNV